VVRHFVVGTIIPQLDCFQSKWHQSIFKIWP